MTVIKAHSPGTSQIQEKDLGEEHAKRYGRHRGYKKGSFELGWKIQPRTPIKGRTKYKWGNLKDFYPPNLANPLTCRIPSLIDFLETRRPKYFFYTLEDWDFDNDNNFPVEKELVCKAIMYWRLMLFTHNLNNMSTRIVKYYLNTANKIITNRMPIFGYWPYRDGLVHYYKKDKFFKMSFNPHVPSQFLSNFNEVRDRLLPHERDIKIEKNLKMKENHWTKVFKSIFEKKEIPESQILKTNFNYENLDVVVSSYIAWNHNKLRQYKNEPKIKFSTNWKEVYSIYQEAILLKKQNPELFESDTVLVTELY